MATNLGFASEFILSDFCNNRLAIVGRSGVRLGVVTAGIVKSSSNKTLRIVSGATEFAFNFDDICWLEISNGEFKVSAKNLHGLDNVQVLFYQTCTSVDYPTNDFFQPGDFMASSSGKFFRSTLFLLRDDGV